MFFHGSKYERWEVLRSEIAEMKQGKENEVTKTLNIHW